MKRSEDLRDILTRIDRRSYPAYKDTAGKYQFRDYILSIDHVQGDPFAAPSKVSVIVSARQAGFPAEYYANEWRKAALQDMLIRRFFQKAGEGFRQKRPYFCEPPRPKNLRAQRLPD